MTSEEAVVKETVVEVKETVAEVKETVVEEKNTEEEPSKETLEAVAERLRFFFSDANVRQDFFIRKFLLDTDGENKGQVPVEALMRFNTIKQHTKSADTVVRAAKELLADKLIVSEDGKTIGVVEAFTLAKMDENIPVSLYISNLPVEQNKYTVNTEAVRSIFGESAGKIALVKFRFQPADATDDDTDLHPSKQPADGTRAKRRRIPVGAALVEFESLPALETAAADTLTVGPGGETVVPAKPLKLGDVTLGVQLLKDYIDSRKKRKASDHGDEKKTDNKSAETVKAPANLFVLDWKPGCVISLKGISGETCDREALLDTISKGLDMTVDAIKELKIYVDYSRGQTDGAIRFPEPDATVAQLCEKLAKGEATVAGQKVESAAILEGDAEKEYWDNFISFKNKQKQHRTDERSAGRKQNKRPRRN